MDERRFEGLTRRIGAAQGRREALRILLGAATAAVPLWSMTSEETEASKLAQGCRIAGQRCGRDEQCCGKTKCARHRCKCLRNGKSCLIILDEETGFGIPNKSLCCSGNCSHGSHECT